MNRVIATPLVFLYALFRRAEPGRAKERSMVDEKTGARRLDVVGMQLASKVVKVSSVHFPRYFKGSD